MSLMKSAALDRMKWVEEELIRLVGKCDMTEKMSGDPSTGLVDMEELTFGVSGGKLRLLGVCPKCTQDVLSVPISRVGDISDLVENFRPMKHHCMDI